ncbi:MAG TPA: S46 family peptidase, partial [Acidobacteriota bacterium]|nr:S46 family peptidase [Acidobacteriota bacterium]
MLRKSFLLLFVFFFAYSNCLPIFADEGMWTFDNPPIKQVKDKFGFEMNRAWLDHVRLAACRLNNGGSGSFVSADGLVLTNHHVASSAIAQLSTPQRDLMKNGFYARTRGEELRCPDLEINVLYAYEEVTDRVLRAGRNAGDDRSAEKMRKAEMADIEKESTERTGLKSTVVTMYE